MSNGWAHCNAFIGEFYEHKAWYDQIVICEFPIRITERWRQAIEEHDAYEKGWGVYPDE